MIDLARRELDRARETEAPECRRADAVGQRRGARRSRLCSSAWAVSNAPAAADGSAAVRRDANASWAESATSRCCAPSWTLRSIRRRSSSAATMILARDARSPWASALARMQARTRTGSRQSTPPDTPACPARGCSSTRTQTVPCSGWWPRSSARRRSRSPTLPLGDRAGAPPTSARAAPENSSAFASPPDQSEPDDGAEHQRELETMALEPRSWRRRQPRQRERDDEQRAAQISEPPGAPHARERCGRHGVAGIAASDPIVALTSVPISAASSSRPSPRDRPQQRVRRANRRISSAAISISSTFPKVWPTAEPTGSAE